MNLIKTIFGSHDHHLDLDYTKLIIQFRNCKILYQNKLIEEDLWVRDGKILDPEKAVFLGVVGLGDLLEIAFFGVDGLILPLRELGAKLTPQPLHQLVVIVAQDDKPKCLRAQVSHQGLDFLFVVIRHIACRVLIRPLWDAHACRFRRCIP